ncbi:unnamed protein product, partial [Brachionus calyciflorus]
MNSGLVGLFGESDSSSDEETQLQDSLPPEIEKGNIEYKLKLIDPSHIRFEHLVTQLKWRLQEGLGEAVYEIGVADNGYLFGLTEEDLEKSMETLKMMAERLGASLSILRERTINNESNGLIKKSLEVLVRKMPEDKEFTRMRIAVLGNIESGKSSLISVLTHDELDNGNGRARLNLLRHTHEIQTGHTSSISNEIMGFNNSSEVENFGNCRTAEEILEKSCKLITFIDLAGHSKYMKTTIKGLTTYTPDFTMLVINANNGIVGTTKEHLGFSIALGLKIFLVINKIDQVSETWLGQIVTSVEEFIKLSCNKIPFRVKTDEDAILSAQYLTDPQVCPIFLTSCVNGTNLDKLKKFLNILRPLALNEKENESSQSTEFQVDDVFFKKKPGHILSGLVLSGNIAEHDKMLLGPFKSGKFVPVEIQTIQRYRVPCKMVCSAQSAAVSIGNPENIKEKIRKGMVLVNPKLNPIGCLEFEAEIFVLFHASQLTIGFQATVHIGNVCQTAVIVRMDKQEVKTNEKAKVVWKFKSRVEYIRPKSRLLFREGTSKGMGEVTAINPFNPNEVKKFKADNESLTSIKKKKKKVK